MDLGLPGRDGFAVIQTLQEYASLTSIPVISPEGDGDRSGETGVVILDIWSATLTIR
jgi:hypothetical protein